MAADAVITNTPRDGETPEQIAARTAPRGPCIAFDSAAWPATMFYLTEPSRGRFIVNFRIATELQRIEITADQLRNFLVDGTAMALRTGDRVIANQERIAPCQIEPDLERGEVP